jgi:hypothetical protein
VLQGDRFYALLQIRALTYGPEYAFAVNCGSDGCRARIEWELDLRELPCRPLSVMDANVLIDCQKSDLSVLGLVTKHVAEVHILTTIIEEVDGLEIDNCERCPASRPSSPSCTS